MKNTKTKFLIIALVLMMQTNISYADGILEDNSIANEVQVSTRTINCYKDKKFKEIFTKIEKDTAIVVISKNKNYITIKYNDKTCYIKNKELYTDEFPMNEENDYDDKLEKNADQNSPSLKRSENDNVNVSYADITDSSYYSEAGFLANIANNGINDVGIVNNSESKPEYVEGQKLNALFTSYYPENSLLQGGFYDALGRRLNPAENTIAGPKEIPFGTLVQINGTGTYMDGKIFTVRDRGGAIKKRGDQYQFDILSANRTQAYAWGRRTGYVRIVRWGK